MRETCGRRRRCYNSRVRFGKLLRKCPRVSKIVIIVIAILMIRSLWRLDSLIVYDRERRQTYLLESGSGRVSFFCVPGSFTTDSVAFKTSTPDVSIFRSAHKEPPATRNFAGFWWGRKSDLLCADAVGGGAILALDCNAAFAAQHPDAAASAAPLAGVVSGVRI